jgi:lambda repressor-like predicted transcriptional regulator
LAPTGRSTTGEATPWRNEIVAALKQLITQYHGRSMRSMTRELGLANLTVQKKMSQDISKKR